MIKRICDNCGDDAGNSRHSGWAEIENVSFGDAGIKCTVTYVVNAPKDDDGGEVDLCPACFRKVVGNACLLKLHRAYPRKTPGPEHFNGS